MTVWLVFVPWDYDSAEIVGVFHNESDAIRAAKNRRDEDDNSHKVKPRISKVEVQ